MQLKKHKRQSCVKREPEKGIPGMELESTTELEESELVLESAESVESNLFSTTSNLDILGFPSDIADAAYKYVHHSEFYNCLKFASMLKKHFSLILRYQDLTSLHC